MLMMPLFALALAVISASLAFFFSRRLTIGLLVIVLIATGLVTSVVSSGALQAFLMIVGYGFPIIAGSIALGIAAGLQLRDNRFIVGILFLIPFPYFVWHTHSNETKAANEKALAFDFVSHNKQLEKLIGGPVNVSLDTYTTYNDSSRGRYEYALEGQRLFAIINVSRMSGKSHFSLACVTNLSLGQREANKDTCQQSTVALPTLP